MTIVREHVFPNEDSATKCVIADCGVSYAERAAHACRPRDVPRAVSLSYHCIDSTEIGDRRREIFGTPAHYDKEGK